MGDVGKEIGTAGTLPVYTESELDAKLALLGFKESSGYLAQASPLNSLTIQNADHFLVEAQSLISCIAGVQLFNNDTGFKLPFLGDVFPHPPVNNLQSAPFLTFYKVRIGSPATKINYTILSNGPKGILAYSLPIQPQ